MKFMKLGSRPDTFYTTEALRSVSSEVSSDLIVQVKGCRYLLHKFPLLSKSLRLQRLCSDMSEKSPETSSQHQTVQLRDFPCEPEAFELCAKFCYGITVTVSAYNIVSARCAAEYLEMTEEVERGNLIHKLEAFLSSCILQGWKDAIITLPLVVRGARDHGTVRRRHCSQGYGGPREGEPLEELLEAGGGGSVVGEQAGVVGGGFGGVERRLVLEDDDSG